MYAITYVLFVYFFKPNVKGKMSDDHYYLRCYTQYNNNTLKTDIISIFCKTI